jgi:putative nucleotidyltransferase with HDIG domain
MDRDRRRQTASTAPPAWPAEELQAQFAEALAAALDAREHETASHSKRVACHTLVLARRYTRDPEVLRQVYWGALLHDIGKIGIADAILLKHGALDAAEWQAMRRHPEIGYAILARAPFLAPAAEIVLTHEERFDGSGYPRGLAREAIPLWSRLFAVIDTLDAMTSDRPYRKALSFGAAKAEIVALEGRQFDPSAVAAFLAEEATLRQMVEAECELPAGLAATGREHNIGIPPRRTAMDHEMPSQEQLRKEAQESVQQGGNVRGRVRALMLRMLRRQPLESGQIRDVVRAMTEGIAAGASATADARRAVAEAFRGLDEALTKSAGATRVAAQDFLATIEEVASRSQDQARIALDEFVAQARRAGSESGRKAAEAASALSSSMGAFALEGTKFGMDTAREAGARLAEMASGALSGMADAIAPGSRPSPQRPKAKPKAKAKAKAKAKRRPVRARRKPAKGKRK